MKISVDEYRFRKEFEEYGRDDQFTDEALDFLFNWYEEVNPEWELDVIECCCTWTEYDAEELADEYGDLLGNDEGYDTPDARLDAIIEALQLETTVITVNDGCFLVMAY